MYRFCGLVTVVLSYIVLMMFFSAREAKYGSEDRLIFSFEEVAKMQEMMQRRSLEQKADEDINKMIDQFFDKMMHRYWI